MRKEVEKWEREEKRWGDLEGRRMFLERMWKMAMLVEERRRRR